MSGLSRRRSSLLPLFLAASLLVHGLLLLWQRTPLAGNGQPNGAGPMAVQLTTWTGDAGAPQMPSPAAEQTAPVAEKVKPVLRTAAPTSPQKPVQPQPVAKAQPQAPPIFSVHRASDEVEKMSEVHEQMIANVSQLSVEASVATEETLASHTDNGVAATAASPAVVAASGFHATPEKKRVVQARFGAAGGPQVVNMPTPVYPLRAKRLGKEGRVLILLDIDHSGILQNAAILEAAGFGFDEAALRAVRQARFSPAIELGETVACQAVLPVRFQLRPSVGDGSPVNHF